MKLETSGFPAFFVSKAANTASPTPQASSRRHGRTDDRQASE
ncbi:hypothetical protein GLA29479_1752 [Lysobacter antibioticus]|nr:hypothetical protein GLA29479_1752 [Lysobacter antibioticus]